jgi:DNA-binding CsgD family transcriptional regulator
MTLLQRLLRTIGLTRPARLSFRMDEELAESLREMAYSQRRPQAELATDLLSEALLRRQEEERKLEYWRSLSPREQEVVALVCLNYTNRQIAERLVISPETVKSHVANMLRKFGLRRRADLRQYLDNWDFSTWDAGSSP